MPTPLTEIKVIAWDFDGVLNRNIVDGRFLWADTLTQDLGIELADLEAGVFNPQFAKVISGEIDLLDHVQEWLDVSPHNVTADTLLTYWFAKDDLRDPLTYELLLQMRAKGLNQVIATNNEARRARYIESVSGYEDVIDTLFSSGRMGVAKPDSRFFNHVTDTLNVRPDEILLIDDSAANVATADTLGWKTFHFSDTSRNRLASYLGF